MSILKVERVINRCMKDKKCKENNSYSVNIENFEKQFVERQEV